MKYKVELYGKLFNTIGQLTCKEDFTLDYILFEETKQWLNSNITDEWEVKFTLDIINILAFSTYIIFSNEEDQTLFLLRWS